MIHVKAAGVVIRSNTFEDITHSASINPIVQGGAVFVNIAE